MNEWQFLARTLFGSATRYEICTWIAQRDNPVFFPAEMSAEGGTYLASTGVVYDRLVDAGLITRISGDGQRVCLYRRLDSPLWDVFKAAALVVGGPFADASGQVDDMHANLRALSEKLHA